jgi:hypothetical protein
MRSKECNKCGEVKSITGFAKDSSRKDGYSYTCKTCKNGNSKKWYNENKEKLQEKYLNNKEEILEKRKIYYHDNKETISKRHSEYRKKRLTDDQLFKLRYVVKGLIRDSFRGNSISKNSKTFDILGCTIPEFKEHLESQFEDWMTWENRGLYNGEYNYGWDIDHMIPISSAETEDDVIRLNHYTNLQPLCSRVNRYDKRDN